VTGIALYALLAALPGFMAPVATLEVGARTELRQRQPGNGNSDRAFDLELSGLTRWALDFRRGRLSLAYLPQFSYGNFTDAGDSVTELLHGVEFDAEWRWRRTRLALAERVAFGTRSGSSLSVALEPDPVTGALVLQPLPANTQLHYVATGTTMSVAHALSRRSDLGVSAGYSISGGSDELSRRVLPLAVGERALLQWQLRTSSVDTWVSELGGEFVRTSALPGAPADTRSTLVGAIERWRRRWTTRTRTELAAGARFAIETVSRTAYYGYPTGSASITHRLVTGGTEGATGGTAGTTRETSETAREADGTTRETRGATRETSGTTGQSRQSSEGDDRIGTSSRHATLELEANCGFDVVIDRLTGLPDRRGQVTAQAEWSLDRTSLRGAAGRAQSLARDDPNSLVVTYSEAAVRYRLLDPLALEAGVRVVDQHYQSPTAQAIASGLSWTTFVAIAFAPPPFGL
jgi:hypothetical protein